MILMLSALPIQASDTPVIKFEDRIEEYNLKNGLKVISHPNPVKIVELRPSITHLADI